MMKRKHEEFLNKASPGCLSDGGKKRENFQKTAYISDPKLIPRLKRYCESHKHIKHLDIEIIADNLRKQYGEYARKKRNTFIKSVEKAYDIVGRELELSMDKESELEQRYLQKKKSKSSQGKEVDSDDDCFSSDNDDYVKLEDTNAINTFMSDMYKGSKKNQRKMSTPVMHQSNSEPTFFIDRGDKIDLTTEIDGASDSLTESFVNVSTPNNSKKQDIPSGTTTPVIIKSSSENKRSSKKTRKQQEDTDKKKSKGPEVQQSTITFADVGGNEMVLMEICKLLVHMRHPEIYQALGVTPPRGFLLHGPPGCGKTLLAHAIAGELDLPFIKLAATEIISGVSGDSEEKIRDLFEKAVSCAPCIVFLDEIDAITPKRETASKDMERRIVSQLLSCMDELNSKTTPHVLIIGATNRPDSIDPALRRAGRFDREISLGIPDEQARVRILNVLCRNLKLCEEFDFRQLARNTPGYVGADLMALTREAAMTAVNRVFESLQSDKRKENNSSVAIQSTDCDNHANEKLENTVKKQLTGTGINHEKISDMSPNISSVLSWLKEQPPLNEDQLNDLFIKMEDFEESLKHVQPSAKREGFATIPDVTWDDIGALHEVREELQLSILAPVRHSEEFKSLGLKHAPGILLAGPPGCGKTLLAKAIANESGINFISVKGPELLNMYVGESERAVRQVFQRARNSSPCVIFFDELDALCPKRSNAGEGGASVRVVNQMLTEMDGLEERKQVFIMAATNRPDIIDPAILRPGRLDKILYVGLPSPADRLDILNTITKNGTTPKLSSTVSLEEISNSEMCSGFTGADLAALVREASVCALKEIIKQTREQTHPIQVTKSHFDLALTKVKPSVSTKDLLVYENIKKKMAL